MADEDEIAKFAEFAKLPVDQARKVMQSKTGKLLRLLADVMAPSIAKYVESQIKPLHDRLAELELHGIKYFGTWQRAAYYRAGSVCTHDGSAFVALKGTEGDVPGASDAWQLMVKRGRDGKSPR